MDCSSLTQSLNTLLPFVSVELHADFSSALSLPYCNSLEQNHLCLFNFVQGNFCFDANNVNTIKQNVSSSHRLQLLYRLKRSGAKLWSKVSPGLCISIGDPEKLHVGQSWEGRRDVTSLQNWDTIREQERACWGWLSAAQCTASLDLTKPDRALILYQALP